jgi:fructose-bisphosphate aldolase, class I
MRLQELAATARALMADGHGLLAMDESIPTCNRRFEPLGIEQTPEKRRDYRELLLSTGGLGLYISGAIFCDETFRQERAGGGSMLELAAQSLIIPGIKVDTGATDMALHPGEKVTEGLDGLRQRLSFYRAKGARFAKWRAVVKISGQCPSRGCLTANAMGLARYAALCQEAGLVPIVEFEVLMDGDHDLRRCLWVTEKALHTLFEALYAQRVDLGGILLKPNMVVPGKECPEQDTVEAVADATIQCLLGSVPASVPGIAFLSGGQPFELATARLKAMHVRHRGELPWRLTFSFSRALQDPVLASWKGDPGNKQQAQHELLARAAANGAASMGQAHP